MRSSITFSAALYFMMEEWDRGISNCERAVSLDPQNSSYYLWLGRLYGEKADRSSFVSAPGLGQEERAFRSSAQSNLIPRTSKRAWI